MHFPDVSFDNCSISSKSGRGVVAIRGARLVMFNSTVSNSAATGIYVGGDGTTGEMSGCTVTDCGRGGHRVSLSRRSASRSKFRLGNFLFFVIRVRCSAGTAVSLLTGQNLTSKVASCTRITSRACLSLVTPLAQPSRAPPSRIMQPWRSTPHRTKSFSREETPSSRTPCPMVLSSCQCELRIN